MHDASENVSLHVPLSSGIFWRISIVFNLFLDMETKQCGCEFCYRFPFLLFSYSSHVVVHAQ